MIEKVKKNIKYLNYLFIVFFTLILLLRPYQFVIFDSEPDYLANAIHTLQWNIPWGGHHPGTIFQYFFAGVLKFSFFYKGILVWGPLTSALLGYEWNRMIKILRICSLTSLKLTRFTSGFFCSGNKDDYLPYKSLSRDCCVSK